jgi:hypothetical protein
MSRGIAGAIASLFIASVARIRNPAVSTCRSDYDIARLANELFVNAMFVNVVEAVCRAECLSGTLLLPS